LIKTNALGNKHHNQKMPFVERSSRVASEIGESSIGNAVSPPIDFKIIIRSGNIAVVRTTKEKET